MRTVLYTYDFEPITVLHLKPWHMAYLEKHGRVTLAAVMPLSPASCLNLDSAISVENMPYVHILAEKIEIRGARHLILFTSEEQVAMLLASSFLPGQIKELREAEREAFARGVLTAFEALSPGGN